MNVSTACSYNASTCYFVDVNNNCLSDSTVLELIRNYVVPTYQEWICIVLYVIVFLVGTIGNLLVIIVIQRNRSMGTVTNMFIMNLAAADLLVLVFCLPATVIQDVTKTWFFGLILCKFVNYIQNMSISVSVLTLMAISIERYQAIVHPLKFSGTKQRARVLILSVWILSLLLVLPDAIMMTLSRQFDDRISSIYLTYCQWDSHPLFDLLYQLHISLCLFVIPLCLMVFTYSGITRVLWGSLPTERMFSHERRVTICNPSTYSDESQVNAPLHSSSTLCSSSKSANLTVQENRQKAAKMLISVVIIFTICYIPVHAFNLFRYIYVYMEYLQQPTVDPSSTDNSRCFQPKVVSLERTGTTAIVTISALVSHFLPYFNSSINPIIYNIMSDKFRIKFRELLAWCCCCCKSMSKLNSNMSTMIPCKSSSILQHSPMSMLHGRRQSATSKTTYRPPSTTNSLNVSGGGGRVVVNVNTNHLGRHAGINVYTHNGPICFRLTNV